MTEGKMGCEMDGLFTVTCVLDGKPEDLDLRVQLCSNPHI